MEPTAQRGSETRRKSSDWKQKISTDCKVKDKDQQDVGWKTVSRKAPTHNGTVREGCFKAVMFKLKPEA